MGRYQFKINEVVVPHPENWQGLVLGYDFDGKKAGPKDIAQLIWCDAATRAQFEAAEMSLPCDPLTFKICFRCDPQGEYEEIYSTTLELKDLDLACDSCELQTPSKRQGASSVMDEQGGVEVCHFVQEDLELFQVQSGGTYTQEDENAPLTAGFVSLVDLVNSFINFYYPGTAQQITGLACNDSAFYVPAQLTITPAALPAAPATIRIEGSLGQVYNINIDPQPDLATFMLKVCQALCCVPDGQTINMPSLEFNSRIATCSDDGTAITVSAYWDFVSADITVGGAPSGWTVDIQDQQHSSQDLYISPKGLFGNQVCMSWDDLKTLVCKLQNAYIRELHDTDAFEFRKKCELGTTLPNTFPENRVIMRANNVRRKKNAEWFVNRVLTGYRFRVKDFEADSSEESWIWQAPAIPGPIGFPASNCLTITESCQAEIEGLIRLTNIGPGVQVANIQILHIPAGGGTPVVVDSQTVNIPLNNTHDFLIGSADYGFPRIGSMPDLAPGDQICVQWDGVTISGVTTGAGIQVVLPDSFWQIRCELCGGSPFLNEDDFYNIPQYSVLTDFAGCSGVQNCTIDDKFYAGLGFAISQQIQGLEDYDDTHFITYRAPGGGARRFPKCFYFQDTYTQICDAYVGEFVQFDYYNAPLQAPQLLVNMLCEIPSPVRVPSYEWTINVASSGEITKSSQQTFVELQGTGRKNRLTFDLCSDEYDLVRAIQFGEVNIDLCGLQGTAVIRDFGMTLGNERTGTYDVTI